MQGPSGLPPMKLGLPITMLILPRPEHPSRKEAVEECLYQGGAKEMLTLFSGECDSKRLFQRRSDVPEPGLVGIGLNPGQGVTGIRRKKPGKIFGIVDLSPVQHDPFEILGEADAVRGGGELRVARRVPKTSLVDRQGVALA